MTAHTYEELELSKKYGMSPNMIRLVQQGKITFTDNMPVDYSAAEQKGYDRAISDTKNKLYRLGVEFARSEKTCMECLGELDRFLMEKLKWQATKIKHGAQVQIAKTNVADS